MNPDPSGSLDALIQALPKTETHLHIEGALPYHELLRTLDPAAYPADPEFRRRSYRYPSFPEFEQTLLRHALPWFTCAERYHEAARVVFAGHVRQNVRYVETSFHLHVTEFIHVPGPAIIEAIRSAAPPGLEVRVFAGMLRNAYDGPLRAAIDEMDAWEGLAGVDLHGFEQIPTQPWAFGVWERMRAAGKVTKCHAGEFDGPARVREAIQQLGVRRVQHGVRAAEDPAVLALLAERNICCDIALTSNECLKVVPLLAAHPLRQFMEAGIPVTLSTDDPPFFGTDLVREWQRAREELGLTLRELWELNLNGLRYGLAETGVRRRLMTEFKAAAAALAPAWD